ncbi:MAG: hypothetical protein M3114_04035 [Thermoproteota archaeon]|nr:hypothetical protein [Thermoproteota archaeon]MDQ4066735.1 hypothetical protein [Thermoproteota archaeon]
MRNRKILMAMGHFVVIPFLNLVSNNFEKDLGIVKRALSQFEGRTHYVNGYKLSDRAEMAAG